MQTRLKCSWSSNATFSEFKQKTAYEISEEHTSELQSHLYLVCRLLLDIHIELFRRRVIRHKSIRLSYRITDTTLDNDKIHCTTLHRLLYPYVQLCIIMSHG